MDKLFKSISLAFAVLIFTFLVNATFAQTNTGDSTTTNEVDTTLNQNIINCDCTPTSTTSPTATLTPTVTERITPTPTDKPYDNGGGPGDGLSDGKSDGRSDGKSSSPIQAVLGLSSTNSDNNLMIQFFQLIAALSLSVLAFKLFRKNA